MKIIHFTTQCGTVHKDTEEDKLANLSILDILFKKGKVCKNDLKSYRPIANLKFLAKTIERVCSKQIQNYLRNNKLLGEKQSAYRAHHSTETALLRVYNDLLLTADKGEEAILVLLDYSAAFDTINHDIFFQRLQNRYGVSGNALCWFKSYFTNRSQAVVVNDCISNVHKPVGGVPQGSVMGPLSFTMYTSPVEDIIKAHGMSGMLYADDTQVYAIKSGCDHGATLAKLGACISDIRSWSAANDMKLNDDKTELIHISSKFRTAAPIPSLKIGTTHVEPVNNARNLGVTFDKNLDMNQHINNICRSASSALHKIGKIRRCLDQQTAETLVHAFVSSRVDNCNSLLYGLPDQQVNKLQRIQNSAARLITRTKRSEHITPILRNLHWLPVKQRINFKILLLTFKCIHGLAPVYLQNLIRDYTPRCCLRSSSKSLLVTPPVCTKSYGSRSFQFSSLSSGMTYRSKLKKLSQ
ncbi:hypothetical protein BSL78_06229 [Apostichopus japonicus]|uniref:Reverse transcriptase domain-containing protein n=1 Tax=Stichopus japonicus TaxID=307972 RepID=A0A2G8L991_STIJA|nr:hypothetical protein BSL78_06229 [Apostichopus japonicus]